MADQIYPIHPAMTAVLLAARNLIKAKGRFHTEKGYRELAESLEAFDAAGAINAEAARSAVPAGAAERRASTMQEICTALDYHDLSGTAVERITFLADFWEKHRAAAQPQAQGEHSAGVGDADELHFNAQRLRNVAALVGVPCDGDDAHVDGARGALLGQIAYELRKRAATSAPAAPAAPKLPSGYVAKHVEGHGWLIDTPLGSRWVAFEGTPAGDFLAALAATAQGDGEHSGRVADDVALDAARWRFWRERGAFSRQSAFAGNGTLDFVGLPVDAVPTTYTSDDFLRAVEQLTDAAIRATAQQEN